MKAAPFLIATSVLTYAIYRRLSSETGHKLKSTQWYVFSVLVLLEIYLTLDFFSNFANSKYLHDPSVKYKVWAQNHGTWKDVFKATKDSCDLAYSYIFITRYVFTAIKVPYYLQNAQKTVYERKLRRQMQQRSTEIDMATYEALQNQQKIVD